MQKNFYISEIEQTKTVLIYQTLIGFMIMSVPALATTLTRLINLPWNPIYIVFIVSTILPYIVYYYRRKLHYRTILFFIIILLIVLGTSGLLVYSFFSLGVFYFFCAIIFSVFFGGRKISFIVLISLTAILIIIYILFKQGIVKYSIDFNTYNQLTSVWATQLTAFLLFSSVAIFLFGSFHKSLFNALKQSDLQAVALKKTLAKAEESDQLKTAFLQNISHEIRTPLNAVLGFSELLADKTLPENIRENYISVINKSSNQLLSLVTDILTVSALETNQETVNYQAFCLNELLDNLYRVYEPICSEKNITLQLLKPLSNEQSTLRSDENKLMQILTNLITNAIKFTQQGYIKFGYTLEQENLTFFIQDSGIGIASENHSRIFERFRQAEINTNTFYGGTGLGLSIAKGFIELLGGTIWLVSELGNGASFYFTINYKKAHFNNSQKDNVATDDKNCTVLIVDDESYNSLLLKTYILKMNLNVSTAENGNEAVANCRTNPHIKLVLMDLQMPVMDGYTAAKLIKEVNKDIIIIAQSAYLTENEQFRKQSNLFDDFLNKPIKMQELQEKLNFHIN